MARLRQVAMARGTLQKVYNNAGRRPYPSVPVRSSCQ
jgi:hypothetical protein